MIWMIRFKVGVGHVHCRLFAAKQANMTFAKCGEFVVRVEEMESLRRAFAGAEFVDDSWETRENYENP